MFSEVDEIYTTPSQPANCGSGNDDTGTEETRPCSSLPGEPAAGETRRTPDIEIPEMTEYGTAMFTEDELRQFGALETTTDTD